MVQSASDSSQDGMFKAISEIFPPFVMAGTGMFSLLSISCNTNTTYYAQRRILWFSR